MLPAEAVDVAPPLVDGDDGSAMWIGGWVAIGVGGAGLVLGTVAGALVLSQEGDLEARCLERRCPPEAHDDARSFDTMRTLTTVGFIVGGVGVALGTTLLIVASGSDEQARVQPLIGPAYAGVRLRF